MKIALGADHRGYKFKERIKELLTRRGDEVLDFGTDSEESCDYPDYGGKAAEAVANGAADFAINICGSGNGMCMVSNKIKGVRAGLGLNPDMAEMTRRHNNANVLCMAADHTPDDRLEPIVNAFLEADFEGGRHERRVKKIHDSC